MLKALDMDKTREAPGSEQRYLATLLADIAQFQDRDAFETLFVRFGPRIKGMMLNSGASPDVAEDLVQDVMLTVWRKASLYAPERGNVSTWIFTIARNARVDRLRRQPAQPYIDVETVTLECDAPNAESELIGSQNDERVRQAVELLPRDQKTVIQMAFTGYKPQSEIARELDLPIGTVKSRMRLAYQKLKEHLEDLR